MKIGNKGFMMAEVIIVSVVSLTILISLYNVSGKVIKVYSERENYYNIDTVYATSYIYNFLNNIFLMNKFIYECNSNGKYVNVLSDSGISDDFSNNINNYYGVNSIYLFKGNYISNSSSLVNDLLSDGDVNKTMARYVVNYLKTNLSGFLDNNDVLVVERYVNGNYYYYYALVR